MKKIGKSLASLVACSASTLALAAPDLGPVNAAATTLADCAKVANEIAAIPVPAGQAGAVLAAQSNKKIAEANEKFLVEPANAQYATRMEAEAKRLDTCGAKVKPAIKVAFDHVQKVGATPNLSQADVNAITTAVGALNKAQEDLKAAIEKLTQDKVRQGYLAAPLSAHFLSGGGQ